MQSDQDLEDGYREAQEFASIGEDISHWEYLLGEAVSALREDICDFLLSHGIDGSAGLYWIAWPSEKVEARLSLLRLFQRHGVRVQAVERSGLDPAALCGCGGTSGMRPLPARARP